MDLATTTTLAGMALMLSLMCGWLGARPAKPLGRPRLVPWRFLMLLSFTGMLAFLTHLVSLIRGA